MVFKCTNNFVLDYLHDKFVTCSQTHNRNTRNIANIQLNVLKLVVYPQGRYLFIIVVVNRGII